MTNPSNYFSIEELAKRWSLKTIDVLERIVKDKIPHKGDSLENIYLEKLGFRRLRPISEIKKRPPEKKFVSKKYIEQYEKQHPELTKSLSDLINHQYLFRQEGPAWKIVFEGRSLTGLKGKGFTYIHYLVSNAYKIPPMLDLIKLYSGESLPKLFSHEVIDGRARKEYLTRMKDVKNKITEVKRNNDVGQKEKAQRELEFLENSLSEGKKGKKFEDETIKAKNRIAKSIERAIIEIEKYDKPAGKHFKKAFKPVKTLYFSYRPDTPIPWYF